MTHLQLPHYSWWHAGIKERLCSWILTHTTHCEIINTWLNTYGAWNQIKPWQSGLTNTLGLILSPTHFSSHLLSVFPKCSQLLSLFRFLHGSLFSLQFLSNLKHKMNVVSLCYLNLGWPLLRVHGNRRQIDIPSSANYGAQRKLVIIYSKPCVLHMRTMRPKG